MQNSAAPTGAAKSEEGAPETETALMSAFCQTRSSADFEALYAATSAGLLAWIFQASAQRQFYLEPSEVLQDTYVNIYRYAGTFRPDQAAGFRGWARAIAGNLIRRASRPGRSCSLTTFLERNEEPRDLRPLPELSLCNDEQQQALRKSWLLLMLAYAQAHRDLSARDRQALELIELEGMSYGEAGRKLAVGLSNMKMIMFRARRRLRELMQRRLTGPVASLRATG